MNNIITNPDNDQPLSIFFYEPSMVSYTKSEWWQYEETHDSTWAIIRKTSGEIDYHKIKDIKTMRVGFEPEERVSPKGLKDNLM